MNFYPTSLGSLLLRLLHLRNESFMKCKNCLCERDGSRTGKERLNFSLQNLSSSRHRTGSREASSVIYYPFPEPSIVFV